MLLRFRSSRCPCDTGYPHKGPITCFLRETDGSLGITWHFPQCQQAVFPYKGYFHQLHPGLEQQELFTLLSMCSLRIIIKKKLIICLQITCHDNTFNWKDITCGMLMASRAPHTSAGTRSPSPVWQRELHGKDWAALRSPSAPHSKAEALQDPESIEFTQDPQ